MRQSRFNNMKLQFQRKDMLYEAIMIDLVLMGALPKETVEKFIGYEIPGYLKPPEGFAVDGKSAGEPG